LTIPNPYFDHPHVTILYIQTLVRQSLIKSLLLHLLLFTGYVFLPNRDAEAMSKLSLQKL
jgi:hypothetical protein